MKQFLIQMRHRGCKTAEKRLLEDVWAINAEKAQMAKQIVELKKRIDELKGAE